MVVSGLFGEYLEFSGNVSNIRVWELSRASAVYPTRFSIGLGKTVQIYLINLFPLFSILVCNRKVGGIWAGVSWD